MKIKEIRKANGFTQKEASSILGVSLRTYKRLELSAKKETLQYSFYCETLRKYGRLSHAMPKRLKSKKKIVIAGCGYVGLSLACLLSSFFDVVITDIDNSKISTVANGSAPFHDSLIEDSLSRFKRIKPELSNEHSYENADIVIIATPTNFNDELKSLDTSSIENVIRLVRLKNKEALIVIKSTVPIGYTDSLRNKMNEKKVIFSPEFLREGSGYHDLLFPSRIVVGFGEGTKTQAKQFANMLYCLAKNSPKIILTENKNAEAIKLFSNTFLAMRVAFFNELDSYSIKQNLKSDDIINGVCSDNRIGDFYNNPSFGYGGSCLPKDTMELSSNFCDSPNSFINSIVESNNRRKDFIVKQILAKSGYTSSNSSRHIIVGIYRLTMKSSSDNLKQSSIQGILDRLKTYNIGIIIYEPLCKTQTFSDCIVYRDLTLFKRDATLIVCNRFDKDLLDIKRKVFTRDLFARD